MRTAGEVQSVLALVADGINDCAISRLTGIPRGTIRDWRHGDVPRRRLAGGPSCSQCGAACLPLPTEREEAYSYLLGQYLGDGMLTEHPRDVFRLRIFGDAKYVGLTAEIVAAIRTVMPSNVVRTDPHGVDSCVVVSAYSKSWPCLFPQHGPGRKHDRAIELTDWQSAITRRSPEKLVRGLIHSDGCRFQNRVRVNGKDYEYTRYNFTNNSAEIRAIFCEHLDLLGIAWRRMNATNISIARREAVARLDEFVGPKS